MQLLPNWETVLDFHCLKFFGKLRYTFSNLIPAHVRLLPVNRPHFLLVEARTGLPGA